MKSPAERFWSKVDKSGPCWRWTGHKNVHGYGQIQRGRRGDGLVLAHRLSWEIHDGPIPDGLCVLHRCDVPDCVRPEHLFLGTLGDNSRDMVAKGRHRPCGGDWPRGERHKKAKLTEQAVREIRASSESTRVLARRFGVNRRLITFVKRGVIWRHVDANV